MSFKSVGTASTSGSKVTPPPPGVKEYTVKLARDATKNYNIMQFNRGDKMDFSKCNKIVMERENNMRTFNTAWSADLPSEGAGSEFGRERREEARRKKYGIISKKYKEENQPWLLRVGGKPEKKYRGKKEGLITENANYYLFTQQVDGSFHAIPVDSWYSFQQSIRHSTLNAEEAEEEFNRRDNSYNYFSLMVQKRLKEKTDDDATPEKGKKKKNASKRKAQSLTILEDDEYRDMMTSEEDSDDDDAEKKKKLKKKGPKRPKKKDSGSEAEEESDNGDMEGEEFDYMSEVSSDEDAEQQKMDIKGLDEEMKHIEEEEEEEEEEGEEEKKKKAEAENAAKDQGDKTTKKDSGSSDGSDESDDSDIDDTKITSSIFMQKKNVPAAAKSPKSSQKSSSKSSSRGGSRPTTPGVGGANVAAGATGAANVADAGGDKVTDNTLKGVAVKLQTPNAGNKRPAGTTESRPQKKARTESPLPTGSKTQPTPEVGLTEDVVRRYLMRKPMTTKDLLVKLNPKKTGLTSVEVVKRVTVILRKLNPDKLKIKDKMYWHIKDTSKPATR